MASRQNLIFYKLIQDDQGKSHYASSKSRLTPTSISNITPLRSQTPPKSSANKKVLLKDFSPRLQELATFAKGALRQATAFGQAFPPSASAARFQFAWSEIDSRVKETQNPGLHQALQQALASSTAKGDVIRYVSGFW